MTTPRRMRLGDLPEATNDASAQVLDAAIAVHRALGPGLLESAYRACLAHELQQRGLRIETEVPLDLVYRDLRVAGAYRADLVVEGVVVVELKCVERLAPEHEAQVLTYLRISGIRLGMLLNFHAQRMRDGFRRLVL